MGAGLLPTDAKNYVSAFSHKSLFHNEIHRLLIYCPLDVTIDRNLKHNENTAI